MNTSGFRKHLFSKTLGSLCLSECPNHPSGCSLYNDLIFISLDKQRKLRNCVTAHKFSSTDAGSHHRHRTCWDRIQSSSLHSTLTVQTRWVLVCLAISNEVVQAWRSRESTARQSPTLKVGGSGSILPLFLKFLVQLTMPAKRTKSLVAITKNLTSSKLQEERLVFCM